MDRTTSLGLWRYANDFAGAARIVIDHLRATETPGVVQLGYIVNIPAYYLACHGIELGLKAYLRGAGAELDDLKRFGHDLDQCLTEAETRGLLQHVLIPAEFRTMIGMVNPYYRTKELEYITTGVKTLPLLDELQQGTMTFLEGIRPFCTQHRDRHTGGP